LKVENLVVSAETSIFVGKKYKERGKRREEGEENCKA
jgi:hypothetical protein